MISANPVHAASRGTGSAALLCALGEEHGLPRAGLLAAAGVTEAELADPEAEIAAEQEVRLVAALAAALPEDSGLAAGNRYRLATYGIWGFALLSSRTLRAGHEVAMRFLDLTYALTRVSAVEDGGELRLFFDDLDVPEPVRRFVLLRDATAALQLWRESLGRPVVPRRVELRLPAPADPAPYAAAFGVPPRFAAPRSTVVFDAALLDQPLPQAAPLTAALCEAQCRELLERRVSRRGLSGQVRDLLLRQPQRMPGQEEVAAELHVSVRTLRRRLAEEGTSFRAVLDQTRRHLAEELLVTVGLSVEEVAERVGYSEASAFVHAFRRWTGASPRRWARTATRE
ncbi:AraC family transcriptional regulator [Blastococcus sp. KM273129]|uniref:AraC family transcriptional regulator n=1 Tax=Blastococcus sp. KM273129 TaxID=2570315 RepID=UPI001F214389|nr:AraC family transcriptional regulator [Blastococcus sp. KM273129]MCF6735199.1 AraC family transcriptional regulator [Blastococcus sp. KM273129]